MNFLKPVFGTDTLDFAQFQAALNLQGMKIVDLQSGRYVDKAKYENRTAKLQAEYEEQLRQLMLENSRLAAELEACQSVKTEYETLKCRSVVETALLLANVADLDDAYAAIDMDKVRLADGYVVGALEQLIAYQRKQGSEPHCTCPR